MQFWRNDPMAWSGLTILVHWASMLVVYGLYALGWYMVDLDYYDVWYRSAPFWHKSIGLSLCLIIVFRMGMRLLSSPPAPLGNHAKWERIAAKLTHYLLYGLLFSVFISGYLISTADGRGISVFGFFELPALVSDIDNLEDWAGEVHIYATDTLIIVSLLHAAAAIKHHFIDRDATLRRMLGMSDGSSS